MLVVRAFLLVFVFLLVGDCARSDVAADQDQPRINFARDIRPILAEHCYQCHGPDAATRRADLRLDQQSNLFAPSANGSPLIVSNDRSHSDLFRRIATDDAEIRMPPDDAESTLSEQQIEAIGQWIDQGAKWQQHWAYESPRRPTVPAVDRLAWPRNQIDVFTSHKMAERKLVSSVEADRRTLIRRVTLDLTGLPPKLDEIDAFLADTKPGAFERVVDRLLQSPRFGERMATKWLDLARYADTHGYHMDAHRDMWRWRDWVIDAYNSNMSFDQFTIEQLAGDLLPNATLSQRIATGFNRNNMVNFENGVIAEEYLTEYAVDRVTTTSTVWLGQTMLCARCHDHKYDPFSQRDFYKLLAFFNQVPENGVDGNKGNAVPFISAPLPHQLAELARLKERIAQLKVEQQLRFDEVDAAIKKWEAGDEARNAKILVSQPVLSVNFDDKPNETIGRIEGTSQFIPGKVGKALLFDGQTYMRIAERPKLNATTPFTVAVWVFPTTADDATVIQYRDDKDGATTLWLGLNKGIVNVHFAAKELVGSIQFASKTAIPRFKWQHLTLRFNDSRETNQLELFVNGELVETQPIEVAKDADSELDESFTIGSLVEGHSFRGMIDDFRLFATALTEDEIAAVAGGNPIGDILAIERTARSQKQSERLKRYYLEQVDQQYRSLASNLASVTKSLKELESSIPTTMVMQDTRECKPTYILKRGRYDSPGELVQPGVPAIFERPGDAVASNRLSLARWIMEPDNPLTARVAVNRTWQQFFGVGLVRTPEDFGTRGELPTHPELLDWLATEFASDWDVKRLVRLIVTSATYRQSSDVTPEQLARDPDNRWLARMSRVRLDAEVVRDNALFVSGLLVERNGGPSVFPYQPTGLWEEIAYNANDFTAQVYRQSKGEDLYRRSLYTFAKRSLPSPTLEAFGLPNREVCTVNRPRTNTPQQALVLMNDVTFVEAARKLAERTLLSSSTSAKRIEYLFATVTGRMPTAKERSSLSQLATDLQKVYRQEPSLANDLVATGDALHDESLDVTELAVWTAVANVLLSLDEVITRP